jgi:hypothetical protein
MNLAFKTSSIWVYSTLLLCNTRKKAQHIQKDFGYSVIPVFRRAGSVKQQQ